MFTTGALQVELPLHLYASMEKGITNRPTDTEHASLTVKKSYNHVLGDTATTKDKQL